MDLSRLLLSACLCLPFMAHAQFLGGTGRGEGMFPCLNITQASSLYSGGAGRGEMTELSPNDLLPSSLFLGGDGRGEQAEIVLNQLLASSLFAGGSGRGESGFIFDPTQPMTVVVALRGVLEGPYDSSIGLMNDSLRNNGVLPVTEPYTALNYAHVGGGGESVAPAVLQVTGGNAIVDWVLVELRSASDPQQVIATQCALLQRDGDVVSTDGASPVTFNLAPANYYVALRHRNHLGVATVSAIEVGVTPTSVDFSVATTITFGTDARRMISGTFPAQAMWAGDVTFNGDLKYTGTGNDRDPILVAIGGSVPTNVLQGYHQEDVTLDGAVEYTGTGNDRDPILVNIGGNIPTNIRLQQLP